MYLKRFIQDILPINQLSLSRGVFVGYSRTGRQWRSTGDLHTANEHIRITLAALKSTKRIHPQLSGVL